MQTHVHILLMGMAAAVFSDICQHPSPKDRKFHELPLHDLVLTQSVLTKFKGRSKLDCGQRCVGAEGCVLFTFLPNQNASSGDCQLYGQLPSSPVGQENSPGARSYAVRDPCEDGYSLLCGRCLKVLTESMTYQHGRGACYQEKQGNLIMTKTLADLQCARCIWKLKGMADMEGWVGADDLNQEGQYEWNDRTDLDAGSPLWGTNEPADYLSREDCVVFTPWKNGLNDVPCNMQGYVTCEKYL